MHLVWAHFSASAIAEFVSPVLVSPGLMSCGLAVSLGLVVSPPVVVSTNVVPSPPVLVSPLVTSGPAATAGALHSVVRANWPATVTFSMHV